MRETQGKTPNSLSNSEAINLVAPEEKKAPVKDYRAKKTVASKAHFVLLRDEQRLEIYLLFKRGEGVKKIHDHLMDTYGHYVCPEEFGDVVVFNRRNVERQLAVLRASKTPKPGQMLDPFQWDLLPKFGIPLDGTQAFLNLWRNLNAPGGSFFLKPETNGNLELNWAEARWYWRLVNMNTGLTIDDLTILSIVCSYLSGLTLDDESSENAQRPPRKQNSQSRANPHLDELENIKAYLAIKPWSDRDAHKEYVDLIKTRIENEEDPIRLVNFTHWWQILIYKMGLIDLPPKFMVGQDIPLMWDYPEYAYAGSDDGFDHDGHDWGDEQLNSYFRLSQGITPSEGIALAKMEFALFCTDLIPKDIDDLESTYIGRIGFEQFESFSKKFQTTWDQCPPYKYDYSTIADKVFPFVGRSHGSVCLWTLLLPLLKSLPERERVLSQLSQTINIDHILEFAENFCFTESSNPSYSEFLGLTWDGNSRAMTQILGSKSDTP